MRTLPPASSCPVGLRGLFYAGVFVLLWAWLAGAVRRFDGWLPLTIPIWFRPVGLVIAAGGALIAGLCVSAFVTRGQGTPAPFDPPREFVASGPYGYVRNPMYLGAAAMLFGSGLALGSPSIVILAAGFLLMAHLFVVLYEEPALVMRFGESYRQYKLHVGRWLIRRPRPDRTRGAG